MSRPDFSEEHPAPLGEPVKDDEDVVQEDEQEVVTPNLDTHFKVVLMPSFTTAVTLWLDKRVDTQNHVLKVDVGDAGVQTRGQRAVIEKKNRKLMEDKK